MTSQLDQELWGKVARMCWTQMALYPKKTANYDTANGILHCLAAMQFPVFDYRQEDASPRPLSPE